MHPIHSLISSSLPSLILLGKKGSAIDALAEPIISSIPLLICEDMISGEVNHPTPTTGFEVSFLTKPLYGSICPGSANLLLGVSLDHFDNFISHRSGNSPFNSKNS